MSQKKTTQKFTNNNVSIIGVSVKEGQQLAGVEQSPQLFRNCGLPQAINQLGWKIQDQGDLTKESMQEEIEDQLALD